ncbi:MAG: hypothetical protein R3341_09640 [Methylophaga sp.]|nr:hypothetical protein [Methylophaga sp.]
MVKGTVDNNNDPVDTSLTPEKNVDHLTQANGTNEESDENRRDLILTHKEAEAGSPEDMAACGEEDTGAGLEFLVTRNDHDK